MSLQVIALCYICMMLATPTIIYLLMTLKGNKVEEVKQKRSFSTPTLHHWANDKFTYFSRASSDYQPCDSYWSDLYEQMLWRQAADEADCTVEEYLATREAILSLEGVEVEVDWEEYQEEEETSCPECGAWSCASILCEECYSKESHEDETDNETTLQQEEEEECEEDEGDSQVTREQIEKDAYYANIEEEEQALWYEDIEAALSASKTLVPRFKKRQTSYGKDRRENVNICFGEENIGAKAIKRRRIKYQW